jgi:hypothetical protein
MSVRRFATKAAAVRNLPVGIASPDRVSQRALKKKRVACIRRTLAGWHGVATRPFLSWRQVLRQPLQIRLEPQTRRVGQRDPAVHDGEAEHVFVQRIRIGIDFGVATRTAAAGERMHIVMIVALWFWPSLALWLPQLAAN